MIDLNSNRPNLKTFTTYVSVVNFLISKSDELIGIAKLEAKSGGGISDDTMETFDYVNARIKHYALRPIN